MNTRVPEQGLTATTRRVLCVSAAASGCRSHHKTSAAQAHLQFFLEKLCVQETHALAARK